MMQYTSLIVIDEYPLIRWALQEYLSKQSSFRVLGGFDSVPKAVEYLRKQKVDVVVTEIKSQNYDIVEVVSDISSIGAKKILAYSEYDRWDNVEAFMSAGGTGFVSKQSSPSELVEAIKAVSNNRKWISPSVRSVKPGSDTTPKKSVLTNREREIVALVVKGLSSKQIADQLCISLKTVESHRYRIFKKLNIRKTAQLADYAAKNKY